jgi:hypothetical protein
MDVSVIEGGEVRFTFSKEEKMKDRFTWTWIYEILKNGVKTKNNECFFIL